MEDKHMAEQLLRAIKQEQERTVWYTNFVKRIQDQKADPYEVQRHLACIQGRSDVLAVLAAVVADVRGIEVGPKTHKRLVELAEMFEDSDRGHA